MKRLIPHPLAELLPMMSDAERVALQLDVANNGQRDPIVLLDGKILDGRNRYEACIALDVEPNFVDYKKAWGDPVQYVRSKAQHRHMSESQRACVAANFEESLTDSILRNFGGTGGTGAKPYITNGDLAAFFGCSADYVTKARGLRLNAPKLFADVFDGRTPVYVAEREHKRRVKAKKLKAMAKACAGAVTGDDGWRLICGDAIDQLGLLRAAIDDRSISRPRLIVIDPPYNIGIDYGDGAKADRLPELNYLDWLAKLIVAATDLLSDDGAICIIIDAPHLADVETILRRYAEPPLHRRNVIVWPETFSQYTAGNFTESWRPILYYTKHASKRVWHGDQVLIPSDRQAKYDDKRADPAGRVPSNVWSDIPRMVDNDAERVPGFPTQIPERLVARLVLALTDPGDLVIDPCNGSGTTGRAAIRHGRRYIGIDKSAKYIGLATASLRVVAQQLKEGR